MSAKHAFDYHKGQWSDIQGHLQLLHDSACGNCMEIGTRRGVSTSALLAGLEQRQGHLWSVDLNDCKVFEGHDQWTFIQADSIKDATDIKKIVPAKLDLLFVDGDHTYEGALSDLMTYGPMAKRILVHDTAAPDFPGVHKAVCEFVKQTGRKVTWHEGSFGMAEVV